MIRIGQPAPPFTLLDHTGSPLSLDDLRGQWVVLYFYPRDDTPGCTVEACDFTSGLDAFRGVGATVIGCSPDSPESHQRFIEKYKLALQLVSDPDQAAMREYGAYGKKVSYGKEIDGVIRSTVLIAPDGTIAHHWPSVRVEGHAEAVRAALQDLQAGRQPGATPVKAPAKPVVKAKTAARAKSNVKAKAKPPARKTKPARTVRKAAASKKAAGRKAKAGARRK